jgi:hypothetical protein
MTVSRTRHSSQKQGRQPFRQKFRSLGISGISISNLTISWLDSHFSALVEKVRETTDISAVWGQKTMDFKIYAFIGSLLEHVNAAHNFIKHIP